MKENFLSALVIGVAMLLAAGSAEASRMVSADFVSTNMEQAFWHSSLSNAYDQEGLSEFYTSGVTDFDDFTGRVTHGSGWRKDFVALGTTGYIEFDLGEVMAVDSMAFWNFSHPGITRVAIDEFALTVGSTFIGAFSSQLPSGRPELADILRFDAVEAQVIRLDILSNHGDSRWVGLGEIAFGAQPGPAPGARSLAAVTIPVPEPATIAFLGAGLAGLAGIYRKRNWFDNQRAP